MTESCAHRAKVDAMAGESSAVPLEAAYLDGMTQIEGRDSDARESAHRADIVGDARTQEARDMAKESIESKDGTPEVILVNSLQSDNGSVNFTARQEREGVEVQHTLIDNTRDVP